MNSSRYPEGETWADYHCSECGGSTAGPTTLNPCDCPEADEPEEHEQLELGA